MSFQCSSSSSATSCDSAVPMCWPISALAQCTVQMPLASMSNHTVGASLPAASAWPAESMWNGSAKPMTRPVAVEPIRNERREVTISFMSRPPAGVAQIGGGTQHCALDAGVGHAAAEIAVHRLDHLRRRRVGVLRQERGGLHDLAGLAV